MKISGFEKLTLLDYPQKIACLIFTQGCNYKCGFCQNSSLIPLSNESIISEDEVLSYLEKRKNVLDGIVISGGEPTIQKDLKSFCQKVKNLHLLVKLDSNGTNPKLLKELINENLIDYVAMDIKSDFSHYGDITGITKVKIDNVKESIELLKKNKIDHEFRTTIMKPYHDLTNITQIAEYIGEKEKYYLQNFVSSEDVLDKTLKGFSKEELELMQQELVKKFPNIKVRGI